MRKKTFRTVAFLLLFICRLPAQQSEVPFPKNLVVENIPPIPGDLVKEVRPYLEFRSAGFADWHPARREMLIRTRFAETSQLHRVSMPGGARRQITFQSEPVSGGSFRPGTGESIVFSQDTGGGEFYQLFRLDPEGGKITLLTDGKSRNTGATWSRSGQWMAYHSTRRNGRDNDLYIMDPARPETDRLLAELPGGGWWVDDWSPDDSSLLVMQYLSVNESRLHLVDAATGRREQITPADGEPASYRDGRFSHDGKTLYVTTDRGSEFQRLCRMDPTSGDLAALSGDIDWNVEDFDLSPDGEFLAFVTNEDGLSVLRIADPETGRTLRTAELPPGVIRSLQWHENGQDLAFVMSSARSPSDVFSLNRENGEVTRWTESETGGLDAASFAEPGLIRMESFDGVNISAFVYRPDPIRFPGPRPVLINIHGGPESQFRPDFQGRNNYFLNEMGVALVFPNVRGSSGYGKTYLTLDNGFKRENSVRDIGTILDRVKQDPGFDPARLAVTGGSYGGYMSLASLIHFGGDLCCGVDAVGISNFVTFLENTQDYRRDLRRVEYGDERDKAMREFLLSISPATRAEKIKKPLLVVQGQNDPRVPASESRQMVDAIRQAKGTVWYLLAMDEGHGFRRKENSDFYFYSVISFFNRFLLGDDPPKP